MPVPVSRNWCGNPRMDSFRDTPGCELPWGRCPGLIAEVGQTGVPGRRVGPQPLTIPLVCSRFLHLNLKAKLTFIPGKSKTVPRWRFGYVDKSSGCGRETKNYHKTEWRHLWFSWRSFHQRLIALCSNEGKKSLYRVSVPWESFLAWSLKLP